MPTWFSWNPSSDAKLPSAHKEMISSLQLSSFSSALFVVFKCFRHAVSSLWRPHECYLLFMPSELLLIILWQCLEGLNEIRAISASHCPSRVATSEAVIQYFWAWDTSPFHTPIRSKYVWDPLPTSAALLSIGRTVWCMSPTGAIAQPCQDPEIRDCRSQHWSVTTQLLQSSSNVVRNETMSKGENELKD